MILAIAAFMYTGLLQAQPVNIIPKPQQLTVREGYFAISPNTVIVLEGAALEKDAAFLNNYLERFYGFKLAFAKKGQLPKNSIVLNYERMDHPTPGAYRLEVEGAKIYIAGDNATGVFYGIQTLLQLLPAEKSNHLKIPHCSITDAPRFAYRGLHLDVCRHFMPMEFVKQYIDYIALFKLNTFHWHLTDDQGWRIEIKKYPKLTQAGAWRDGTLIGRYPGTGNTNQPYGGFYTQKEIKEVVQYAADRHITVIPEIEMPGHASAAIAAYPQLSCYPDETTTIPTKPSAASLQKKGKKVQETWGVFDDVFCPSEYTFNFLQDVLDEVVKLFPGQYIHIGGDECPKTYWKKSEFCQNLIKEKGLKDEHGLQSYFIQRIEKYLNTKGRQIIGWDEILEGGLAPNASVMSWRGEAGGIAAAKEKHHAIMTPGGWCYFDYAQHKKEDSITIGGYVNLQKVYSYDPVPAVLQGTENAKYILGAQANMWTEYLNNTKKIEYMLFPRLAALSEVLWTNPVNKNWEDFEKRIPSLYQKLDLWKANYSTDYETGK